MTEMEELRSEFESLKREVDSLKGVIDTLASESSKRFYVLELISMYTYAKNELALKNIIQKLVQRYKKT